jgi:hypothetical protein
MSEECEPKAVDLMKPPNFIRVALLLALIPAWAQQQEAQTAVPAPAVEGSVSDATLNSDNESDRMLTPPPVSGEAYPLAYSSEEQPNYLRGGVTFNTAYSDNVLGGITPTPVSDESYSVWPTLAIDQTRSRLHWMLSYAPGFTFYEHTSSRNEADQNLALDVQYRLSPHVTVTLHDGFQRTSNVFNQPDEGLAFAVTGSAQSENNALIAPIADRLSNVGGAEITYQFSANAMVGASGTFSNLHYPDPAQVPGLYDAASRAGSAFYSHRFSQRNYVGITYQYQELLSYASGPANETQTHGAYLFYTFYSSPAFSFSLFGGPQYYTAGVQFAGIGVAMISPAQSWAPAAGASLNWQARRSSVAASYSHSVSGGGGLVGAVELDSANVAARRQITRNLSAAVAAAYGNNGVLALATLGGHSLAASAAVQRQAGEHFNVQAGYTRLHQDYAFFAANPDSNREWVAISYQFARPLGR